MSARIVVIRDDGDCLPDSYIASRNGGHLRAPISRRSIETGEPVDLRIATSFIKRGVKKHTVPEFTSRLEDKWLHTEDSVVMKVNFRGYPEPMVYWFKDQEPVFSTKRHMIHVADYTTELMIFSAQKEDAGFYTCRIENDMGIRETNCQVYIGDSGKVTTKEGKVLSTNFKTYRSAVYTPNFVYSRHAGTWM